MDSCSQARSLLEIERKNAAGLQMTGELRGTQIWCSWIKPLPFQCRYYAIAVVKCRKSTEKGLWCPVHESTVCPSACFVFKILDELSFSFCAKLCRKSFLLVRIGRAWCMNTALCRIIRLKWGFSGCYEVSRTKMPTWREVQIPWRCKDFVWNTSQLANVQQNAGRIILFLSHV